MWIAHVLCVVDRIYKACEMLLASYKTSLNTYVHGLPYLVIGTDPFGGSHTFSPKVTFVDIPVIDPTNPTHAKFACVFHFEFEG